MIPMLQSAPPVSREEVQATLEKVLARGEFHGARRSLVEELAGWLSERIDLNLAPGALEVVVWILVGVGLALLLVLFARLFAAGRMARRLRAAEEEPSGPSVSERVAALREEARAARERGELSLALRKHFHALVLGLGGRGALEFHDAWTNRELLRRGRPTGDTLAILSPLVSELEAKEYGGEPTDDRDLDRLEGLCERFIGPAARKAS